MEFSAGKSPTRKQFLNKLMKKIDQTEFYGDMKGLLRPDIRYDHNEAWDQVREQFIEKI